MRMQPAFLDRQWSSYRAVAIERVQQGPVLSPAATCRDALTLSLLVCSAGAIEQEPRSRGDKTVVVGQLLGLSSYCEADATYPERSGTALPPHWGCSWKDRQRRSERAIVVAQSPRSRGDRAWPIGHSALSQLPRTSFSITRDLALIRCRPRGRTERAQPCLPRSSRD